ncbi:MAG: hypothetical protein QXT39_04970 [Conexivisphaerales archaeon]
MNGANKNVRVKMLLADGACDSMNTFLSDNNINPVIRVMESSLQKSKGKGDGCDRAEDVQGKSMVKDTSIWMQMKC